MTDPNNLQLVLQNSCHPPVKSGVNLASSAQVRGPFLSRWESSREGERHLQSESGNGGACVSARVGWVDPVGRALG